MATQDDYIRLMRQMGGWLPIETAPRDGTNILLCVPGENLDYKKGTQARTIGYYAPKFTLPAHEDVHEPEKYPKLFDWCEKQDDWVACEGFYTFTYENYYGDEIARAVQPTHWMSLPPPPGQQPQPTISAEAQVGPPVAQVEAGLAQVTTISAEEDAVEQAIRALVNAGYTVTQDFTLHKADDLEKVREALEFAENEMRYAGWYDIDVENQGRVSALYEVNNALRLLPKREGVE